jgi:hypothetical protein
VYGEVFNAALESAAFLVQDPHQLIDIALSYIPPESESARAVQAVLRAQKAGLGWTEARKEVMTEIPNDVAQYSPINLGFQVIGLLYGTDFGDGMCKTVNCGFDTDSSGAAIGSYLGVIHGAKALPQKWVEPLGDTISTNEDWGGVKHMADAIRPVPQTLDELVGRIRVVADKVLRHHGLLDASGKLRAAVEDLYADEGFAAELADSSRLVIVPGADVHVTIDYGDSPVIHPDTARSVTTSLTNVREERLDVTASLAVPEGWERPAEHQVILAPGESSTIEWAIPAVGRGLIVNSNRLRLDVALRDRPTPPPVPFVLVGAHALRVRVDPHPGGEDLAALEATPVPAGAGMDREGQWIEHSVDGNDAELERVLDGPAVVHVQAFWNSPDDRHVRLGADTSSVSRLVVNGEVVHTVTEATQIRPSLNASPNSTTGAELKQGWNELLWTIVRGQEPLDCHVLLCTDDKIRDTMPDVGRARLAGE